jgi:hypothetical protein
MQYLAEFKSLNSANHIKTSEASKEYNCIAYAAGRLDQIWWPIYYPTAPYSWPLGQQDDEDLDTFIAVLRPSGTRYASRLILKKVILR